MTRIRRLSQRNETSPAAARPVRGGVSRLAGACQVVTIAVVLLALLVVGAAAFSRGHGLPGPPPLMIACHLAGAVAAVLLQRGVSRAGAAGRGLAALGVVAILGVLLWFFWWH